jgi:pimeloyl-ACP methyl ester carboxylesterase
MSRSARPPTILVPGLLGTATVHYGHCREWWTGPVVETGLPGHGTDPDVPAHPARDGVRWVRDTILGQPEPPLVVGLSYLGAALAFRAAQGLGDAVHGVVVSGYSFVLTAATIARRLRAFTTMAARQPASREHFTQLHGDRWDLLLTRTLDELADGCLRLPDRADLSQADTPVLLVNGALLANERRAIEPAAECGADVAVVAGAGHVVPQDSPRAFVAVVEDFAERISAERTTFHDRRRVLDQPEGSGGDHRAHART